MWLIFVKGDYEIYSNIFLFTRIREAVEHNGRRPHLWSMEEPSSLLSSRMFDCSISAYIDLTISSYFSAIYKCR